jgi:hypothetical protein
MGALSIAFDIIIVGALALPWVLLVIHLFFSNDEKSLEDRLSWVKDQNQPALAGVLLFAMTYSLGSAVSRIAQDFFDDDDLHVSLSNYLFRVGVTESSIRTDVYCHSFPPEAPKPSDPIPCKRKPSEENSPACTYARRWLVQVCDPVTGQPIAALPATQQPIVDWINDQEDKAGDSFHVDEAKVLSRGTDPNVRLRQFHDQIMVLRGAAFNGMVAFSLCLFWWFTKSQSRLLRLAVPLVYFLLGGTALYHHLLERSASEPPYMEFTLLVLAFAGWYVLWPRALEAQKGRGRIRFGYLLLAAFLTVAASLGWWSTEVLYDQQVIYSYQALPGHPTK